MGKTFSGRGRSKPVNAPAIQTFYPYRAPAGNPKLAEVLRAIISSPQVYGIAKTGSSGKNWDYRPFVGENELKAALAKINPHTYTTENTTVDEALAHLSSTGQVTRELIDFIGNRCHFRPGYCIRR